MEPRQSGPTSGYERAVPNAGSAEYSPASPEVVDGAAPERREILPDRQEREPLPPSTTPAPVLPTPVVQDAPVQAATATSDDNAMLAADDDLIEKEWVDRAKKILNDTRDDPHIREREISKLQAEYIQKRYGRIIGNPTE